MLRTRALLLSTVCYRALVARARAPRRRAAARARAKAASK
jgi:hypothetical protein